MRRFYHLTFRYMTKNGRRTLTTVIGVVISAVLLFLLFEIPYSIEQSKWEYGFRAFDGGTDLVCEEVDPETALRMREDAKEKDGRRFLADVEVSKLSIQIDDGYMAVYLVDDFSEMAIPVEVDQGTMPKNDSEVVIKHGTEYEGELVTVENVESENTAGEKNTGNIAVAEETGRERELRIGDLVIAYQRAAASESDKKAWEAWLGKLGPRENWTEEDFDVYSAELEKRLPETKKVLRVCGYQKESERVMPYNKVALLTDEYMRICQYRPKVCIVLADPSQAYEAAERIADAYGLERANIRINLREMGDDLEEGVYAFLLLVALAFSILLMLMIRNAFNISVDERLRDYGVLRCVGLTRRQIFKMLLIEAIFVALAGSILGMLVGYGVADAGLKIASEIPFVQNMVGLHFTMHAAFSWKAILYPAFVVFIATAMSMISPVEKLFRMSPVDAQRKREKVRRPHGKSLVDRKKPGIEGIYGFRSARRTRGRYIRTVVSFALGMTLVVGAGTMVQTAIRTEYLGLHHYTTGIVMGSASTWIDTIHALEKSDVCEGMEGGIICSEYALKETTSADQLSPKQMIKLIGVTNGIWNAIVEEAEKEGSYRSISSENDLSDMIISALAIKPTYAAGSAYSIGDSFDFTKAGAKINVIGTVSQDTVNQILSNNMGMEAVSYGEISEQGYYIFPLEKRMDVFSNVQIETIWENPDYPGFHFSDVIIEGGVYAEAAPGQKEELYALLEAFSTKEEGGVINLDDSLAGLYLARNVFFVVLAFILVISTINTINVSRGEQFARRDETFVLRAIGMSERQRRKILLTESVSASALASVLGIVAGLLVAGIVTGIFYRGSGFLGGFNPDTMRVRFTPDYIAILISVAAVLITGWITSFFVGKDVNISEER